MVPSAWISCQTRQDGSIKLWDAVTNSLVNAFSQVLSSSLLQTQIHLASLASHSDVKSWPLLEAHSGSSITSVRWSQNPRLETGVNGVIKTIKTTNRPQNCCVAFPRPEPAILAVIRKRREAMLLLETCTSPVIWASCRIFSCSAWGTDYGMFEWAEKLCAWFSLIQDFERPVDACEPESTFCSLQRCRLLMPQRCFAWASVQDLLTLGQLLSSMERGLTCKILPKQFTVMLQSKRLFEPLITYLKLRTKSVSVFVRAGTLQRQIAMWDSVMWVCSTQPQAAFGRIACRSTCGIFIPSLSQGTSRNGISFFSSFSMSDVPATLCVSGSPVFMKMGIHTVPIYALETSPVDRRE